MNINPSQSQRLPSFRDYNDLQKVVLPFPKNKLLNKKTYVPNLDVSRKTISPKVKEETSNTDNTKKLDGSSHRREKKFNVVQTDGVFSSGIEKTNTSSKFGNRSSSTIGNTPSKGKQLKRVVEKLDGQRTSKTEPPSFKDVFNKRSEQIDKHSSISVHDLPAALPWIKPKKNDTQMKDDSKINSLLTDILKPNDEESPLFLLKTPKFVPAILDNSENPKMNIKQNDLDKNGYKCTIYDLPEGQIGKLQIMKSGKMRLVLGECKFWLEHGINVHFKEELAVVNADSSKKVGEIVNLGEIKDRIVVVPDYVTELIEAT